MTVIQLFTRFEDMNIYMALVCLSCLVGVIGLLADAITKTGKAISKFIAVLFLLIIGVIIMAFTALIHKAFNTKFVNALSAEQDKASEDNEI